MSAPATTAPEEPRGFAAGLRGFGPLGIVAILIILAGVMVSPLVAGALILIWVWLSKTPWRDIGIVRPKSWAATIILAVLFGVAFKVLMKAIVMPYLGAPPVNQYAQELRQPAAALEFIVYAILGAGIGEELVFRGWLFERLRKIMGAGVGPLILIVLISTALFGIAHYMGQGWFGVVQATIVGFVFGVAYAATGRLIPLMIAHAAFDLTALAMIYFGLESRIAHLVFP
jgi:membrane protease YdiL (CAAX protease family)